MASQAENEKLINALKVEVAILNERVDGLDEEIEPLREITKQVALIEHKLSEMTKTKELWGQRGWMILTIGLSASFSFLAVIFGGLLTYYLNSKK